MRFTTLPPSAKRFSLALKVSPLRHRPAAPTASHLAAITLATSSLTSPRMAVDPGLMMPDLSVAISMTELPKTWTWSRLTLVITLTEPVTTLVESHVPPIPTSMTPISTAWSAKYNSAATVRISNRVSGSSLSPSIREIRKSTSSKSSSLIA